MQNCTPSCCTISFKLRDTYAGLDQICASLRCSVAMLLLESALLYSSGLKGAAGTLTVWMARTGAVSMALGPVLRVKCHNAGSRELKCQHSAASMMASSPPNPRMPAALRDVLKAKLASLSGCRKVFCSKLCKKEPTVSARDSVVTLV